MMYDFLLEYAQEHETCQVPLHYEYLLGDGTYVRLGLWLNIQNQMMIKGVLRPDRQLKLQYLVDLLLLEWDSNKYENYKWLQMYDILLKYGETFGNYHVSSNYDYHIGDGTTIKLGAWLSQQ